ncbi:timeless-domain-containing protein [Neocallimastix californiae]|uniref:Timeless-domain-containing protein n=1 Tax=Neocallimastix californiae TaxID=1754190 RepID=A0A1Y2ADW6_9FUNG|nr:timeless-domain-containing protein [Neocallimastix californiae]|eukprot:ORY20743.1 timeless-domain-containing protein [Neocallimastix californiae]
MEKLYEAHLLSVCSALGGFDTVELDNGKKQKKYIIGDECYDCLKDLKKFLRQDDANVEKHVSRALGSWMIVQKDLIPILIEYKDNDKIAMAVVEVLVPLTWPIEISLEEIKNEDQDLPSQLEYLISYKEAIISTDALNALFEIIIKPLSVSYRDRTYRETALIRLIFLLIRNLLCIKDKEASVLTSTDKLRRSTLQEKLMIKLQKSNFIELLLSFAGSLDETEYVEWNMLILEIFYHMYIGRDPEEILSNKHVGLSHKVTELLKHEQKMNSIDLKKRYSRHSRFGGSYFIEFENGKKLNILQSNAINLSMDEILDNNKKIKPKIAKKDEKYLYTKRITDEEARAIYKSTADLFVENCFNSFYTSIKKDFDMQRTKVREIDYIHFIWFCSFILKYREYAYEKASEEDKLKYSFDSINSILNVKGLLFIVYRLKLYQDEKKWQEIGLTLYCLKYVLITLNCMSDSDDENYREASKNLQHNLYYEEETLNIIINLCRNYKTRNSNKHFLRNLIETIHILLKMLEKFSKENKYLYTRKQKAIRKKNENESNEVEEEEINKKYYEHEFHFTNVEQKFASDTIINTYIYCLEDYKSLKESTIHQITKMFYRIAIKCGLEPMFFKLSIFELFNRILSEKEILPNSQSFRELYEFINYIVNSFFIYLEKDPMLSIGILFQKSKKDCLEIKYGSEYFDTNKEEVEKKNSSDDEIEVKAGLSKNEKLSVAISLLKENKKEQYIQWIKDTIDKAAETRDIINYKDKEDEQSKTEKQENTDYVIEPEDDNQKVIMEKDQQLRLLMNLLGFKEIKEFESPENENENENENDLIEKNVWIIPKEFTRYELMETRKLIILYENDPIELLSKKPASKLIRKVKKRGQRKRVTHRKSNGNGKGSEVITTDLSAPYILDEKDNTSDSDDDEAFNAFLKREAELRQRTYEKHEKIIEEENEKRSQALLKREKILKNIETKINNNKKSRKTRSRQSTDPIEIPDGNNALKSIEIEDDNNDDQIETIISPKPTKKKLLKLSEMNIISDEDDDYEEDTTTNDNKNISQELKLNDNLTTTSTNKNQNIGIAFESDTESDSDFEFQFKSLQESFSNKKESETETDILKLTTLDTTHTDNNTSNIMEFKDFTNSDINNNKRKIDESNDIKEIENNIENIQINSKKRKKMLIVESDSESD